MSASSDLSAIGISIRDRFIAPAQIRCLVDCARARRGRGEFAAARVGNTASLQRRADIRGDFTCWLREPLLRTERALLEELEALRLELNRETYLGLFELELHYAWYPPGAGYARHLDQPHGSAQRKVSLALYLNMEWEPDAGGALRIFDAVDEFTDIEPLAGRLVCFLTQGREHAVLPARRDRLSISGWFRARG
ncbi:MAG: 2OG-Fe(II) oxygenase [Steroidobacteraceae bacterium]